MQTAGLSDRELVPWVVSVSSVVDVDVGSVRSSRLSHDPISEPRISDHLRLSSADSTALLAASSATPRSFSATNCLNCQE
jgi:hypothetical protein